MWFASKSCHPLIFGSLILFSAGLSHAATLIHFKSERGDYIGAGQTSTLTTDDGSIDVRTAANVITVSFDGLGWAVWWNVNFAAPGNKRLRTGTYEGATRYPFQSPAEPGLDFSGSGRGCNQLTGRFDILEVSYSQSGQIKRFAADFEQHCENSEPALFGSVRYNSDIALPQNIGFLPKPSIKANGGAESITVTAGATINLDVALLAGDRKGVLAEKWLGLLRPAVNKWYDGTYWRNSAAPVRWGPAPLRSFNRTMRITLRQPGVYLFMFAVDERLDGKLNTQYVDHVVVTVLPPKPK